MATRGVILLAHGARDPAWSEPFEAVRRRIEAIAPQTPVALAYLDFMTPDLAGAARELVARGCNAITVVPAFLGIGGHVRRDVPALCASVSREHAGVALDVVKSLGEDLAVQDAMAMAAIAAARSG